MAILSVLSALAAPLPATYAEVHGWRAVHERLPAAWRLETPPAEEWWGWRGHDVHLDVYEPPGVSRGTVVLVHGGGGHGRLLAPFARTLHDAGYRIVAPDLPGFGLTRVPRGSPPRFEGWVDLLVDLCAREAESDDRVALYGLSLGGTAALHAAMRAPEVDALVVTTLLDLTDRETLKAISKRPRLVPVMLALGSLLDGMRLRVRALAPLEAMATDAEVGALLRADPLIGRRRVPVGFFRSLARSEAPVAITAFDRVPILLAHPSADTWTPEALSRPTFDALPAPTRYVALPGAGHFPTEAEALEVLDAAVLALLSEVWE